MLKRTILIVDDQLINRKILGKILAGEYEILEAEDGEKAMNCLQAHGDEISAVLLDIVMPVKDGYEVLREMGADPKLSKIPVIVSSQKDGDEDEVKALSLGAQDFIAKPYKADIIRHRLGNTIKLRETAAAVNKAERDELTGLYNKQFFMDRADAELKNHPEQQYDLFCLGVERFKLINDACGIAKGEELLRYIADVLLDTSAEYGVCGHFSPDFFYVLLPQMTEGPDTLILKWIERINEFPVDMDIKIYCGIYQVHAGPLAIGVMCDRAQLAAEKNRGKYDTLFSYYDDSIRQKLLDEQFITSTMQTALDHEQFHVYYQPKYDLQSEMVAGAEALVRWIHPEKGLLSPGVFIPIFERNGFITQLDRYVWESACRDLRRWMDLGYPPVAVSVNVSRADIYNPKLAEILQGLLEKYNIPIRYLHLEITESAYTDNPEQIIAVVQNLHDIGFIIEMDDFGSGYSSLNMLAEMSVDVLKLDMRFVQSETANTSGKGIMSFVISLAKWMRLSVVAEGVENADQIATLRSMDCNYVQGFYYAKPMPRADFETILRTSAVTTMKTGDELLSHEDDMREASGAQSGVQMLIVDDIAINRAVLAEIFADEYVIVEKENGKEAWEYLEEHESEIEIVLLDLLMPVMDGFQLLKHMQGDGQMSDVPVIVTSQGDAKAEQRALEMGADDFISKPYNPDVVCHRVHNVVGNYRNRKHHTQKNTASKESKNIRKDTAVDSIMEQIRYRSILNSLDVAFFERNDRTGEVYISDQCLRYMVSDPEELKNGTLDYASFVYPEDMPLLEEFLDLKNKKMSSVSATLRLKLKDGSYRRTELKGFYEYDEEGNRIQSIDVMKDAGEA